MTRTRFDVVVFDFDGTLVRSADIKRVAFFEIFPADYAPAVETVLKRDPDGPRTRVIPAMVAEAEKRGLQVSSFKAEALIEAYADRVAAGVGRAPEIRGAADVLKAASAHSHVYVASVTPHEELLGHLARRDWTKWVREAYGFPAHKPDVVKSLLEKHSCAPQRLLVVGDGESDEGAARSNKCAFLKAVPGWTDKFLTEFPS